MTGCVKDNQIKNVELYKLGLWNSNDELYFESDCGQSDRVTMSRIPPKK